MHDHAEIWQSLRRVVDPVRSLPAVPIDIVDMGLVKTVRRDGGRIGDPDASQRAPSAGRPPASFAMKRCCPCPGHGNRLQCRIPTGVGPGMIAPEARERLRKLRPVGAQPHDGQDRQAVSPSIACRRWSGCIAAASSRSTVSGPLSRSGRGTAVVLFTAASWRLVPN